MSNQTAHGYRVDQAQAHIQRMVSPVEECHTVELRQALDRILAHDVVSPIDVPAHDNSAMDGYAFRSSDLVSIQPSTPLSLTIIGTALAGQAFMGAIASGQCVRIMTGAVMPDDCDTVLPQELALSASATTITLAADAVRAGDNRRHRGEDLAIGKVALSMGRLLRPADLGLLASLGIAQVSVRRRLKVVFFSTGDELRSLGQTLDAGCIYDSNRYTIFGMLARLGCELLDLGVVADDPIALRRALEDACAQGADAIITSGGVSVGKADYVKQIMQELGEVDFWKLLMRPGRPMAFGRIKVAGKQACLFGLPGNPVAVMVSFYFFVRAALLQMMGAISVPTPILQVSCGSAIRKKPGRTEYQRGIISTAADGRPSVNLTGSQGAGVLRSMAEANCIILLGHDQANVNVGDMVDVVPFEGLV